MMRFNVKDPNVFNQWRDLYYRLTSEEHIQFIEDCAVEFPSQHHFTKECFHRFFLEKFPTQKVMEIGGWKGELAAECIGVLPIKEWHNFEVCSTAILNTVRIDKTVYTARHQKDFFWFKKPRREDFDCVVSSNTLEHLGWEHVLKLMDHLEGIPLILIEAPLLKEGENFNNYWGTHILEKTWDAVRLEFAKRDYNSFRWIHDNCYLFVRRYELP